jgi:hypothetical protein
MVTKHFNHTFVSDIPIGVADRYYAQDFARDFWHSVERASRALYDFYGQSNILIKGGTVSQGSDVTHINVTAAVALCQYTVDIPDSFAALPPTATTATLPAVLTDMAAQTDFSLSGATLNGSTTNYVKLAYAETNGNTRSYAKKSGTYAYERIPSFTLTCTSAAPAANEVELARLTGNGTSTLTITRQTVPKNAETLQDKICPVGTLRNEMGAYQAPSQNYPWLCLDTIGTFIDVSTTVWDDAFIAYLRAQPVIMFDGTASPQSTYAVTNWAVSSNVGTVTLSAGANEVLIINGLSEDQTIHGSFTNWRTITVPTIGNIPAGTYAITAQNAGARTFSFSVTAADGSAAVSSTCEFYAHRIAGSTTTARLWGAPGVSIMSPNDVNGYHISSLRRRGYFQGHVMSQPTGGAFLIGGVGGVPSGSGGNGSASTTGSPTSDGINGTPLYAKTTHGPEITAHLYINGRNYKL